MDKKQNKIIKLLKKFKKEISKIINVNNFILFGSRARGEEKEISDIDLLIISENFKGKKSFERSPEFYVMWDENYDVDFICLTPEEFKVKRKQIGIIKNAAKEGIEI